MFKKFIVYALDHPKKIIAISAALVIVSLIQFPRMKVDTDPENMLPDTAPVRVFHHETKKEFGLYDIVVLGIVNEKHPQGAFNIDTLRKVYDITEEIKRIDGVIAREIVAPSTKDNIEQGDVGSVKFNWLMDAPPKTQQEALDIREQAKNHPIFEGSVASEDGKAVAIYVPIEQKDMSYEVARTLKEITDHYQGDEEYYITGLPVAEDQFGGEMFKQMAISAPLAGLVIFLLMWFFFKSAQLVVAPMLVAVATVLITMGLLIGFGFPVHIMSSMIPIFLMPIAVLDSVHILSEFFDSYHKFLNDRKKTILYVLEELFSPMLFTSLTSAVGFFSLSFSPIPPVQVFGIFVAVGVLIAWALTLLLIPAYIMLLDERSFAKFRSVKTGVKSGLMNKSLAGLQSVCMKHHRKLLTGTVILVLLSLYGISQITVNDNPVRWFTKKHPIRIADRVLNKHFSGTYEAYLVFEAEDKDKEIFIMPEMLRYIEDFQREVAKRGDVGKTTSLADIVKKVYYELLGGDKMNNVIPRTKAAVAQCLISFENSHKPDDLWHLTTPDYSKANIWFQLKSGDNKDMNKVVDFVDHYIKENPPPHVIAHEWAGLTYINVVWQDNMVVGMLKNFMGSFIIVFFMMLFLFRSPFKALISMIPLTVTILFIYGLLGYIGKDYDMPVAVLSALTLGLSIDFAIHFIQRSTEIHNKERSWEKTAKEMFGGPGRAIVRNALVVAIGFLPLLAAPLVPYKTVGFFMFSIMAISSFATLIILPSIISANPKAIFPQTEKGITCHCGQCILVALAAAVAVAYFLTGYTPLRWPITVFITIIVIVLSAVICHYASGRKICLTEGEEK